MNEFKIGTYIRRRREELGLSQEELALGICSPSTLSRIENNQQDPSRSLTRQLLGRLNLPQERFLALWDQKSISIAALMREINNDMIRHRQAPKEEKPQVQKQIREKMEKLGELAAPDDRSTQQFLLSTEARLDGPDGPRSIEERLEMQLEAIRLTCPAFDPEDFRRGHYTMDECVLINQIANSYSDAGQQERAIDMYRQLLWYVEKNTKELSGYSARFTLIAHNYAIDLLEDKQYARAIEVAEQGLETCRHYEDYYFLPGFLAIQAESNYFFGKEAESKKLYLQAYYIYEAYGDKSNQENMRKEMKEYFGMEMPESMTDFLH